MRSVTEGARARAEEMLRYASPPPPELLEAVVSAATFHDLGKLDGDIQAALRRGRNQRLKWDHIDAGVAHLSASKNGMAAWLVRAHHSPGLPKKFEHFDADGIGRRLRGRRDDARPPHEHAQQTAHTDALLPDYLSVHERVLGASDVQQGKSVHGLAMRLALSCLVDADHSDTAFFEHGRVAPLPVPQRWEERLEALSRYVRSLPEGRTDEERKRNKFRRDFFDACLSSGIADPMVACEAPVGLGKTTAIAAYLLRAARDAVPSLRRLVIVAPYTNILTQTADRLRRALVLPGENPEHVVAEHHHRAEFERLESRDLAVLWRAPIILTTAVSFFETLAACRPAGLRKLHALPGSGVFLDEAHASLPTKLWPQNWLWLQALARDWGCRFVFASGSLARFWEDDRLVPSPCTLPDLLPTGQAFKVLTSERSRVRYERASPQEALTVEALIALVRKSEGPRLVILNTVQNAAMVALAMRNAGMKVLHLSTALCPGDRECIVASILRRLEAGWDDWALVATSCVEAGVDFSFRTAFRQRFAASSTLQVGGRVNRHAEYTEHGGGVVYDFTLCGEGITEHPAAATSGAVLEELLGDDSLNNQSPADVVTQAMRKELDQLGGMGQNPLLKAEAERDYPSVEKLGRVIEADTHLAVVDPRLKEALKHHEPVDSRRLLRGSVQLWARKIELLRLTSLHGRDDVFLWNDLYEPDFLGYMAGVLNQQEFMRNGGAVI